MIFATEDNGDLTGFCYCSFGGELAVIWQIAVQRDARRMYRALLLVDAVEREALEGSKTGIKARVAADLESNAFWKACGFLPTRVTGSTWMNRTGAKNGRPLIVYVKHFAPLLKSLDGRAGA